VHEPCRAVSASRFLTGILDLADELAASARKAHNPDHRAFCCKAARDFHGIVARRVCRLPSDAPDLDILQARVSSLDGQLTAFDT
jgi:hypothetical protein